MIGATVSFLAGEERDVAERRRQAQLRRDHGRLPALGEPAPPRRDLGRAPPPPCRMVGPGVASAADDTATTPRA